MYLYITDAGNPSQQTAAPSSEDLEMVDAGDLMIIRWNNGQFEQLEVDCEDVPDDEDDDESDTHEEYSISGWSRV